MQPDIAVMLETLHFMIFFGFAVCVPLGLFILLLIIVLRMLIADVEHKAKMAAKNIARLDVKILNLESQLRSIANKEKVAEEQKENI